MIRVSMSKPRVNTRRPEPTSLSSWPLLSWPGGVDCQEHLGQEPEGRLEGVVGRHPATQGVGTPHRQGGEYYLG